MNFDCISKGNELNESQQIEVEQKQSKRFETI